MHGALHSFAGTLPVPRTRQPHRGSRQQYYQTTVPHALPGWLQRFRGASGSADGSHSTTSVTSAQTDEAAGYKKRAEESAQAGVLTLRPPSGGDPPPPGSWSWTLNWDPVLLRTDGSPEARLSRGAVQFSLA